jgi:hypothetical protein
MELIPDGKSSSIPEGAKVTRVGIIGHVSPGRMEVPTRMLADVGCEIVNVQDKNDLNGMEYDQVFMDDLCEERVRRMAEIPQRLMYPKLRTHSRGKGKKYKDWDRR